MYENSRKTAIGLAAITIRQVLRENHQRGQWKLDVQKSLPVTVKLRKNLLNMNSKIFPKLSFPQARATNMTDIFAICTTKIKKKNS